MTLKEKYGAPNARVDLKTFPEEIEKVSSNELEEYDEVLEFELQRIQMDLQLLNARIDKNNKPHNSILIRRRKAVDARNIKVKIRQLIYREFKRRRFESRAEVYEKKEKSWVDFLLKSMEANLHSIVYNRILAEARKLQKEKALEPD